ncbi:serine hydrolase domain-containing protein [Natribacillus halophilus]|uniref:CubicO group peptidase, beta-lactamase class C family n=1 Tax=Natribacillus halophilus TaxID=549003 RepID=A0A1G8MU53_9BACI|nr:serine hydrolase domain-containing protein [Natribacillus halophilus]SDI71396.1 CubicO group peptidase, beta-lactamase class C family [Natribacillus halophilus]
MAKRWIPMVTGSVFLLPLLFFNAETSHAFSDRSDGFQPGSPGSAGMVEQKLNNIDDVIKEGIDDQVMPGAVVLTTKNGVIAKEDAYGEAAKYLDDDFTEMDDPVAMQADTIFDVASITKVFTAISAMQLYEDGEFDLDDPVANYIPEFTKGDKSEITIRHLITHTSGFEDWVPLYMEADSREEAYDIVFSAELTREPGSDYVYSDLNMITLAAVIEHITGERLDEYIEKNITEPLGMDDTMFNPPESMKDRTAATEYQPEVDRGLVWGEVHDENAWVMDGVSGHAGLFSTARDLAVFGQMFLNEGEYEGERILQADTVKKIGTDQLPDSLDDSHGLGWELDQAWYMGDLSEPETMGHTGFTGTSMVINPNEQTMAIVLTNRVHPTRDGASPNDIRESVADQTAAAIDAWDASYMASLVEDLDEDGEFAKDEAVHALQTHLTAVHHYEDQEEAAKVIRHTEGFQDLMAEQKNNAEISQEAFHILNTQAEDLIEKWE